MVIAVACGCKRQQESALPGEADEHAEEVVQSTLFASHTEFFVEYDPLVVGEASSFRVHVTDLDTYKPRPVGSLKIELAGLSVSSRQPESPGIFQMAITPEQEGEFPITYTYFTDQDTVSIQDHAVIHVIEEGAGPEDGILSDDHEHALTETGEITFLKEQAWNSDFMVSEVHAVPFAAVIQTSGEILAVPGAKKSVVAPRSGMIQFLLRDLVQGSSVTAGQRLFSINDDAIIDNNLRLQYNEALNAYDMSRSEYLRHRELFRDGAISERQFISTRTGYVADSLRLQNLERNISGNGLNISAPITGTIHELNVSDGAYTETGRLMATISSNRELLIRADLPQQYFDHLKAISTAHFRPAYSSTVYAVEEMNGQLLAAGITVAENDHYLPVIFKVQNDGSLLEGAYAEIFLQLAPRSETLVLPVSAILEEQGNRNVYVLVTGESFTKRKVTTGSSDGRQIEILAGLAPGERVVTRGVMLLRAASMSTGVATHEH